MFSSLPRTAVIGERDWHVAEVPGADPHINASKLIRKLRWMGMEEEAQRVRMELAQRGVPPADSVVAAARETD